MFNEEENKRYSRHFLLSEVGKDGQLKLKNSSVLVIGAGGLGCPALQYLTAAGVGTIGIVDFDQVDHSNLQRQILFAPADIGMNKAEVAAKKLAEQNPNISFNVYASRLDNSNALEIIEKYDVVLDGTDNFSTRYLINDACVIAGKPLVYGAIFKFDGQLSVFNYKGGPTYRCLFPEPPEAGSVPNCSEIGVIGVLPGIIGSQQANEALKIILGIGNIPSGKLLMYKALETDYTSIGFEKDEESVQAIADDKEGFLQRDYAFFCGEVVSNVEEISAQELKRELESRSVLVVDVRDEEEMPKLGYYRLLQIPLSEIEERYSEIDTSIKTVVICQSGMRSAQAIEILQSKYNFTNLLNLQGGMNAYD